MAFKYSRVHRLLKLLTLIQSRPYGPNALARECNCTTRTIFRDLTMLKEADIPVDHDPEAGGYRVRRDFFMPPVQLTLDESLALMALAQGVDGKAQIPFTSAAVKALAKIRGQLPEGIRQHLDELEGHVAIRLSHTGADGDCVDVYDRVRCAIANRRSLRCKYQSVAGLADASHDGHAKAKEDEQFLFNPYTLFFSQRAWYAVGYHAARRAVRSLKLTRFVQIENADKPYMIPDDFSLDAYLGNAWRMIRGKPSYDLKLYFDKEFADTVAETNWHKTQSIEWQDDGSILFRCTVDGLDEVTWWVLSMGPHCVVQEPKELAKRVAELARGILNRYAPAAAIDKTAATSS